MYKNKRGEEMIEDERCQQIFENWKLHEVVFTVLPDWREQKSPQRGKMTGVPQNNRKPQAQRV